ncbi:MAG: glycogen-binding domain-containing protein [Nitrospirota bacterium]
MNKNAKTSHDEAPGTTTFSCDSREAQQVFLAGTFNNWNPEDIPMKHLDDGTWSVELSLEPGNYEYKFVVDGVWWAPLGEGCVTNPFGTLNCTIEVPMAAVPRRAEAGA